MPILEQLTCLNIPKLLCDSYKGRKMMCCHNGRPRIRVLKLWMLENLEGWFVYEGAMPQLGELEIRCCLRLHKPVT